MTSEEKGRKGIIFQFKLGQRVNECSRNHKRKTNHAREEIGSRPFKKEVTSILGAMFLRPMPRQSEKKGREGRSFLKKLKPGGGNSAHGTNETCLFPSRQ